MSTSKNKTFTEKINLFILDNPDFKLSQEMKDFLLKIDNENKNFSDSDGYKLYDWIFQIWSMQHNILLKPENREKSKELLHIHIETLYRISKKIENCKTIENSTSLKDEWLDAWELSINELDNFNKSLSIQLLPTHKKGSYYFNTSSKEEFGILVYIICFVVAIIVAFILVVTGAV